MRPLRSADNDSRGGIGYQEPINSSNPATRSSDPATAFLRKQLLRGGPRGAGQNQHTSAKPLPRRGPHKRDDSDDEEEGRSGLGRGKAGKSQPAKDKTPKSADQDHGAHDTDSGLNGTANGVQQESAPPKAAKKRGSSYLDEVLASRAAKKKKKFNKDSAD